MNQPTWASAFLRNRHLLVLSILVILVGGVSSLVSLPRLEDPRIVNRNPMIITQVPGASAQRVETLVTEPLERSLQEISAIKDIESTSTAGVSIVTVELKAEVSGTENKEIFAEIRDKVGEAATRFPPEAREPLIDDKRDPVGFTLITAVRWTVGGKPNLNIMNRVAEELANRLRAMDGTELVRLYGAPDEEIRVTVDPRQLADLELSAQDLSQLLISADAKRAAGTLRGERSNVILEVEGELDSVTRIAAIPIASNGDQGIVRVGDIARVERTWQEPADAIALVDGGQVIFVATRMDPDRRVDHWANDANALIDEYKVELGRGVTLDRIFEQERYTSDQLSALVGNLVAGAAVVMAVIFVMMGWRLALVVGSALPLVVALVMLGWQVSGNAIHQMSVYGMIIALGLLIDNAIVVADEVARRKSEGLSAVEAVEKAVRHLFLPLMASTVTTVLAFAPILLLPGSVGDFVGSIGSSVIMALIASFAVAITIVAALSGIFAQPADSGTNTRWWQVGLRPRKLQASYRKYLAQALRRPWAAVALAVFLPVSGFIAATQLGNQFFPQVDRDMFHIKVWLPTNSSIANTTRQARAIEQTIRDFNATERVYWLIGGSFPTVYYNLVMNNDNSPYYAQAIVTATSAAAAKAMIEPLQAALDEQFPQAQVVIAQFGQGPPLFADIEYRLYGPSLERLQDLGEQVRLALQSDPDVLHTQASIPRGEPKLWFDANEDLARLVGLSLVDIATQLQTNLEGSVGGTVIENLEQLPVRVRYDDRRRGNLADIASMQFVRPQAGGWVSMHALGKLELRPELGGITRFNAQRTNSIKGYTRNGALPIDVTYRVLDRLQAEGFSLPTGYRIELGGTVEQDAEATGDLLTYVPLIITLTVATLILLFGSGALASLLGLVGFLSIGLGLLATWAMGFPVSFNTILGTLGLVGLAFNNSIVVLAAIRANPAARDADVEAVVNEVLGTTRHIISTTLTTIGGFLPLLMFVGGDFWPSLSIVLAGGVGGSMILALLLIPAAYVLIHRPRRPATTPVADRTFHTSAAA
ncbi:MAG: efflux RND transporter permease subunit [Gammaproteobacteria bacterium]|nr:efflux RND transporter permease subunit [Gammaproteobacteria bacterium]